MNKIGKTILAQTFIKLKSATSAPIGAQLHLQEEGVSAKRRAETFIPWPFSDALIDNPEFCALFIKLQEDNPNPATLEELTKQYEALTKFDSMNWITQLKTAPLILAGEEDRICPVKCTQEIAFKIPNVRLHVFSGTGHVSPVECSSAFSKDGY